jgi:aminopeptidase YwaD
LRGEAFGLPEIFTLIDIDRLRHCLKSVEGFRHGWHNYEALEERASFIAERFRSSGLPVESRHVPFHGRSYSNIVATLRGRSDSKGGLLLGAHYDAASGSPGADDNASGVSVLLEIARIFQGIETERTIEFVAFTLEEPQPRTTHFLIGSNHFAEHARRTGKEYEGVLILESVGYCDDSEGSQIVPVVVRTPVPKKGNFLGVVANGRSAKLMEAFVSTSRRLVPELGVVPYRVPLSGRLLPQTRFSDHSPFWDRGYPALMLTDTAMFRNPHYHTGGDVYETIDFNFLSNVARAVAAVLLQLSGFSPAAGSLSS